jgi:hypothetical protein
MSLVPYLPSFSGLFLFCFSSSCVPHDKQNKNNPEKLVTWGTQDEDKQNKNNPKKLAT